MLHISAIKLNKSHEAAHCPNKRSKRMSVEQNEILRQSRKCTVFLQALHDKSLNFY